MKAYNLNHFWHDLITGKYMVEFIFGCPGQDVVIKERQFDNKESAERYVYSCKLSWVKICIEKYIHHKKHIIEANGSQHQKNALEHCLSFYNDIEAKACGVETICKRFLKGKSAFEAILPSQNNASYQSSVNNLNEIIKFCNQHNK
jgi:hypothetical protein